jgi:hypothetical protein
VGSTDDPRDHRLEVARYQVDRLTRETGDGGAQAGGHDEGAEKPAAVPTRQDLAAYVEVSIQQAERRGDFDNLPGAGKPLAGLRQTYDPNWWIRRKIETERLTGLGPPALALRTEDARLDATLDSAVSERAVRDLLEDFNHRVIEARRQLLGGPPVITPTRDVENELARWRQRRSDRYRAESAKRERDDAEFAAMTWRERRRAKKLKRRESTP